jgi:hypothetical protein
MKHKSPINEGNSTCKIFFTLIGTDLMSLTTQTPNSALMGLERNWTVENTQLMVPLKCLDLFLTDEFVNTGTLYKENLHSSADEPANPPAVYNSGTIQCLKQTYCHLIKECLTQRNTMLRGSVRKK